MKKKSEKGKTEWINIELTTHKLTCSLLLT